jgi:hypothetical protein
MHMIYDIIVKSLILAAMSLTFVNLYLVICHWIVVKFNLEYYFEKWYNSEESKTTEHQKSKRNDSITYLAKSSRLKVAHAMRTKKG